MVDTKRHEWRLTNLKKPAGMHFLTPQQEKVLAKVKRLAPSKLSLFLWAYGGAANEKGAIEGKCLHCSNLTVAERTTAQRPTVRYGGIVPNSKWKEKYDR